MNPQITVALAAHPARVRNGMLLRAQASIAEQTHQPAAVAVAIDPGGQGAAPTRQRALDAVQTEWTAFLDSDDAFMPHHLQRLAEHAQDTGADYVYSWFETVPAGLDPFPQNFGRPFDPADPVATTITILIRTELAKSVGMVLSGNEVNSGEDHMLTAGCVAAGARIVHLPEVTWWWHIHGQNSSGLPTRGDAVWQPSR